MLAKVVQPNHLIAELKVAETQARDVQIGQPALVDTHNGTVSGEVTRVDPAVQNGTVTVDVKLSGELPKGARPDLSVDGTIDLERLDDVLYVGRPAFGQENSTISLFKLDPDGRGSAGPYRLGRRTECRASAQGPGREESKQHAQDEVDRDECRPKPRKKPYVLFDKIRLLNPSPDSKKQIERIQVIAQNLKSRN